MTVQLPDRFPRYTEFDPLVPVRCVTPGEGRTIHRYWDTSPFSPSGRWIALTRFPTEARLPQPGDVAQVVLVNLEGGEERIVADTRGWDTQLGAQAQWGASDSELFYNDLDTTTWRPFGVKLDPSTGEKRILDGTIYAVTLDGKWAVSPCLRRTAATQAGYGVIVPAERRIFNHGIAADDGVYVTNIETGKSNLLVSLKTVVETVTPRMNLSEYGGGDFYAAHVKWNPQGDRIMLVLRWIPSDPKVDKKKNMKKHVITMRTDGSDIHMAIPNSEWGVKGGHHPIWCPDGETVLMNLGIYGGELLFVTARYDGGDYHALHDTIPGSGHPSLHPNGRHIVTDTTPDKEGIKRIRLVDLQEETDKDIVRIRAVPDFTGPKNELRVDPHPAWDREFRRIAFNACPDGTRRVMVADLTKSVENL
ncbi:MAG: hypothetical protein AB1696_00725 [Planctomycetota bacterium]